MRAAKRAMASRLMVDSVCFVIQGRWHFAFFDMGIKKNRKSLKKIRPELVGLSDSAGLSYEAASSP
jgi:hypothetical protein